MKDIEPNLELTENCVMISNKVFRKRIKEIHNLNKEHSKLRDNLEAVEGQLK